MKIRQGNVFTVNWVVTVNNNITLSSLNTKLMLTNPIGQTFYPEFTIADNTISFTMKTKLQQWTGKYLLTLYVNEGMAEQSIVDKINAFEIVDQAEENITTTRIIDVGESKLFINPGCKSAYQVAVDNGFEGTEVQWLESLKQPAFDAAQMVAEMTEDIDIAKDEYYLMLDELDVLKEELIELINKYKE